MINLILGFIVFGILSFFMNVLSGGDLRWGVAREDNNTKVIAEPLITGKSVSANIEIKNDNDFAIRNLLMKCTVHGRSGTNLKVVSKNIFLTVPAKGSVKLDNFALTYVKDFPRKLECRIARFSGGPAIQNTKQEFRKIEIK